MLHIGVYNNRISEPFNHYKTSRMKTYSIPLFRIDNEDDFKNFSLEAGGRLEDENTAICFSGALGRGYVKKWHLDAGLYVRMWDCVFSKPVELIKDASPMFVANNGFSLLGILTPATIELKSINQHQQFNKQREKNFALVPDAVSAAMHIHPHLPVQLIDFTISSYWLKQQPGYIHVDHYFNDGVVEDAGNPVLAAPCSPKNGSIVSKLFNSLGRKEQDITGLLSLSISVIRDFLNSTSGEETDKTHTHIDLYYEKVKEAEAMLVSHLQKTLPRLSFIAQKVALSESTMKRYFKLIYGRSIYEYYLNKKMEMARELILQRPLTVNEAAEIMGYEKVSNFIDIFKKYHGCSPGSIKKKQLHQLSQL
jgi:AraC-like DNA-binding protein